VADAAHNASVRHGGPLSGALIVTMGFRFPMPESRPPRTRKLGTVAKTTAPDLDKLVRAVNDGLAAGGLIVNDARIARSAEWKDETIGWTGVTVQVSELDSLDDPHVASLVSGFHAAAHNAGAQ